MAPGDIVIVRQVTSRPDRMRFPEALKPAWDECANDTFSVISQVQEQRVDEHRVQKSGSSLSNNCRFTYSSWGRLEVVSMACQSFVGGPS